MNYWERYARQRYTRRRVVGTAGLAGAGGVSAMLVGCGDDDDDPSPTTSGDGGTQPTQSAGAPKQGGQFRWAWQGTPHLDMHQDSVAGATNIIAAAYNRLLRYQDEAQLPEPDLAEAMPEQPDDTTFVFTVREGVKFHNKPPVDGRVMTAEDIAFSLNRARTDDPLFVHRGDLASVDVIEAIDGRTVRITTRFPNAVLLTTLAGYQFFVLAPETLEEFSDLKTDRATIGTGGFVVDTASTDQGANLSRHPDFWREGEPYFDSLEQLVIADHWSQFLAGNIETATLVPEIVEGSDSYEAFLENEGLDAYVYHSVGGGSAQGHFMNNGAPPFDDIRVREAINLIMDREPNLGYAFPIGRRYSIALGDGHLTAGFGLPEDEILAMRGFRQDQRDQDIQEGLALLAEAGYTKDNPLRWEIMGWSVPHRLIGIDQLQLAAEMYSEMSGGVLEPSPKGLEWGTWKQAEARHEFQMISSTYAMGVDAHEALQKMYHSEGGRNFAQFRDPDFDAMLQREQGTFDLDERRGLVQEMLRYLNDPARVANAWLGSGPLPGAIVGGIKGMPTLFDAGKVSQLYWA